MAYRFLIVLVQIPRYEERCYVLPVRDLSVLLGEAKRKPIYLFKLKGVRQMSNAPDFERYENAWHLFSENRSTEANTAKNPKRVGGRLLTPSQARVLELFHSIGSSGLWGGEVAKRLLLSRCFVYYTLRSLKKKGHLLSLSPLLKPHNRGAVFTNPYCITPLGIKKLEERKAVDRFLQNSNRQG